MDWTLAIEKNLEALKRILAMLVAMVEVTGSAGALPSPALKLPRHLHRFVLRLLRPAEAAARRLIIVAARGLAVELAPPRPRKPRQKPLCNRSNGFGTGVVIRPGPLPEWALKLAPKRSTALSLPLLDPLKRFGVRRRYVKQADVPRIRSFDDPRPAFLHQPFTPEPPSPPSPDDLLDARRLARRLEAIGRVLDDLPGQAKRFARWQARRDAAFLGDADTGTQGASAAVVQAGNANAGAQNARRFPRLEPMRPGRPPGWQRKPSHPVDEVLNNLHGLAVWARERPDTS